MVLVDTVCAVIRHVQCTEIGPFAGAWSSLLLWLCDSRMRPLREEIFFQVLFSNRFAVFLIAWVWRSQSAVEVSFLFSHLAE